MFCLAENLQTADDVTEPTLIDQVIKELKDTNPRRQEVC